MDRRSTAYRALIAAGATWLGWEAVRRATEAGFSGRVVLITGGSRGLGLVLARQLAGEGARLSICARDRRGLDGARRELERRGARVLAVACDVARPDQVEAWVRQTREELGPPDVLINNASIIQVGPFDAMTVEDFRQAMAVNFWGTVHATYAVLPDMRRRGSGRIVNITSIGGKVAVPHLLPYSAAKFAAVAFSEGLRAELAGHGIIVTTVVPGLMRTGSPPNAFFKGDSAAEFTWFSLGDATPLTAVSADRAARRILRAARRGRAEATLTWQARLLRLAQSLFPGTTADLLGLVSRVLPPAGDQPGAVRGMKLASRAAPSRLTGLMNRAARQNNQYGGVPRPSARHARQVGLSNDAASPD